MVGFCWTIGRVPPVFAGVDALVAAIIKPGVAVLADAVMAHHQSGRAVHLRVHKNAVMVGGDEIVGNRAAGVGLIDDSARGVVTVEADAIADIVVDVVIADVGDAGNDSGEIVVAIDFQTIGGIVVDGVGSKNTGTGPGA